MIQTGTMKQDDAHLALLLFHLDVHDNELKELGVTRDEVLSLAREFEMRASEYRRTELRTIAAQLLVAYKAGREKTV